MRVAIVANVTAPYRTELFRHVQPLAGDLAVFFQSDSEPLRTWERRPDLPYRHAFLRDGAIWLGKRRIGLYGDLGHQLAREDPDVVVGYGFSLAVLRVARFAKRRGIPLLIACDGTRETDPVSGPEYLYRRALVSRASGFIAASHGAGEYFVALGASSQDVTVVELTCDLVSIRETCIPDDVSRGLEARIGSSAPRVVLAARLVPDKRVFEACEAILDVSRAVPDVKLVIAGDGPLRDELERWIRERGMGHVVCLGLLSGDEMIALYRTADLLLFPSVREKFGMVVIEALASGVPVIAYRKSGAARDLVRDGINGYLIEEGDVMGMAARIRQTLLDPAELSRMKRNAPTVIEEHDVRIEAKKFMGALRAAAVKAGRHLAVAGDER